MNGKLVVTGLVFALLLSAMVVDLAEANPLPSPMVVVQSPRNNVIYPSNTVQISFTPIKSDFRNLTSFTYVLDGQSPVSTNGTAILTDLSPGSHTLKIYCTLSTQIGNETYEYKNQVAYIVYFNTEYSMAWITFTVIAVATATIVPSLLFFRRRQISGRFKRKKSGVFWSGACLIVLGSLALIPFAWKATMDSLFPYWPRGIDVNMPYGLIISFTLTFVIVGLVMMWIGTRHTQSLDKANGEQKYFFG